MSKASKRPMSRAATRITQIALVALMLALWHIASRNPQMAFFFGEPLVVVQRLWAWFTQNPTSLDVGTRDSTWFSLTLPAEIYPHLIITLTETLLAFVIGTVMGLIAGLWLALSRSAGNVAEPFIQAANAMPRVILAPIFALWFGLGIWSKVALAVTLVFFIVFFNVYRGVREVNRVVLDNARMLGASQSHLMRHVYMPSATSWVFSSLHSSVGLAFVGAVVGEYLGSARGVGYLIQQAEGTFDVNSVVAGIVVLTVCALLMDALVSWLERHLLRWQPGATESDGL